MHIVNRVFYFIARGEISVYLVKTKVISVTSEMIGYFILLLEEKSVYI